VYVIILGNKVIIKKNFDQHDKPSSCPWKVNIRNSKIQAICDEIELYFSQKLNLPQIRRYTTKKNQKCKN